MSYAKGKQAYGICDISGFRYKLKDMKRTWDGLLVGPDQWNEKHPQLEPRKHKTDPEALFNPRPDKAEDGGTGFVVITSPNITKNFSMVYSFKITIEYFKNKLYGTFPRRSYRN